MSNNAANYEIQDGGSVCRIILPPRKLGDLRRFAWIPLILGGVTLLFMVAWISTPLWWGIDLLQKGHWFGLLLVGFAMTGLFGLRTGLLMVAGGIAALRETTASTLEIRLKTLVCIEEFGPLKWRRRIRIRDITKLSLGSIAGKGDARQLRGTLQGLAETESVAVHQVGKEFHVAVAYPREILIPLANELAERLDRQQDRIEFIEPAAFSNLGDVSEPVHERPRIAVELENSDAPVVPTQPVGSTIVKHEVDGSTVFQVPPTGIWQGSRGLMFFAILWNGFMTAWTLGLFVGGGFQNAQGAQGGQDGAVVSAIIFTMLFWAIGIALATAAINMGRRSTMIGVSGDTLLIKRKSIFGEKRQSFQREELSAIEDGPSGMEVNDRPIYELQICPRSGKKTGLLSQRTDAELEWLAHELSLLLQLEKRGGGNNWRNQLDSDGRVIAPASGAITVSETMTGQGITVPALGMTKGLGLGLMSILFVCVGVGMALFSILGNPWGPNPMGPAEGFPGDVSMLLFAVVFSSIGAGIFVVWRVVTTRRFDITLSRSRVTVERFGLLSRKTLDWPIDAIGRVSRVRSDTSINQKALEELEIEVPNQTGFVLMTGRAADEIDFVAAHINLNLGRPPNMNEPTTSSGDSNLHQPTDLF